MQLMYVSVLKADLQSQGLILECAVTLEDLKSKFWQQKLQLAL